MYYVKEFFICFAGLVAPFLIGPINATFGLIAFGVWFVFFLPRGVRAATRFQADMQNRERKMRIETQILRGKLDGQLIDETVREMRSRGDL